MSADLTAKPRSPNLGRPKLRPFCPCCGSPTLTEFAIRMIETLDRSEKPLAYDEISKLTGFASKTVQRTVVQFDELFGFGPDDRRGNASAKTVRLSRAGKETAERLAAVKEDQL